MLQHKFSSSFPTSYHSTKYFLVLSVQNQQNIPTFAPFSRAKLKNKMPKLREKQKQLVERVGVAHEREGLSPAASRILGMLLVADETEHTFEDIQATLGLSKSAVSNALNFLLTNKSIEYSTRPGDRRRYFSSSLPHWPEHLSVVLKGKMDIMSVYKQVLAQRTADTEEFNAHLANLLDFMEFINHEIPQLIEKWKASRS